MLSHVPVVLSFPGIPKKSGESGEGDAMAAIPEMMATPATATLATATPDPPTTLAPRPSAPKPHRPECGEPGRGLAPGALALVLAAMSVTAVAVTATSVTAGAAEITVIGSNAFKTTLEELTPAFESASGHRLAVTWGATIPLKAGIEKGAGFD